MITKKFCWLSFAVMILFAVIAAGGCGGSSGDPVSIGTTPSPEPTPFTSRDVTIPTMSEVLDSPEFEQVVSELEQELRAEGVDPNTDGPNIHYVMILSGDAVYLDGGLSSASAVKDSGVSASESISDITKRLSALYESGDVIALYFPTPEKINQLCEALGDRPTYYVTLPEDERTYPEIYAVAKRKGVSANHYFTYEVQGSKALLSVLIDEILSSSDVSSSESYEYEVSGSEDSGLRNEYLFQSRRYANFIKWTMLLDKKTAELDAGAVSAMAQFKAASGTSSGSFLDMSSQNFEGDAGYFEANYEPEYPVLAKPTTDIHYDSGFSFTVYSAHNYANKDDYYLFRSNAYTTPKNFEHVGEGTAITGEYGYTRLFNVKAFVKDASSADVILGENAPKTVDTNGSITDGISTTITGTFGQSQTLSANLASGDTAQSYNVLNSLTYTNSQTWETKEWVLRNKCAGNSAEWAADLTGNQSYVEAGTVEMRLESEWIWRVKNAFSLKSDSLVVDAELTTRQGFHRKHPSFSKYLRGDVIELSERAITTPKTISVKRPNQIFVGQKAFNSGKDGGTGMFKLLCNNDYTITSSQPSWCHVSDEMSKGSDTGANEREISLRVDAFNAEGAENTRSAVITVTDTVTGDKMEITVVQSNK